MRDPAGERNTVVTIQKNVPAVATDGQPVATWETQFQRRAKVVYRGSAERLVFEQMQAEVDCLVRLCFDVETKRIRPELWRVLIAETEAVLNIGGAVNEAGRNETIELRCTEVVI